MIDTIAIKINGKDFVGMPIKVLPSGFVVSWKYLPAQVTQQGYEVRLGSFSNGLGTDGFIGNIFSYNAVNQGRQSYAFSPSVSLPRSREIYGQIRLADQFGNLSAWKYFTTYVNDLPHIVNASFNSNPSISNGISLSVIKPTEDIMVKVRWYQNGKLQSYLDDTFNVPSRNIEYGDSWLAQVIPYDDLENGFATDIGPASIATPDISGSGIQIFPSLPNPDDILEVRYDLTKNGLVENSGDESIVRWYVNEVEATGVTGSKFARLNIRPGDKVHVRVDTNWSGFDGTSLVSSSVIIRPYNLQLKYLVINGANDAGGVSYDSVNAFWSVSDNIKNEIRAFTVKVGHAEGGGSVYTTAVLGSTYSLFLPPNTLRKGMDYYLSIAPVDASGNVGLYETIYFKTFGNTWLDNVSARKGYTILLNLKCNPVDPEKTPLDVLSLNVSDGTNSYVVDFYTNFVRINVDSQTKIQSLVDNTVFRNYIISVFNNAIFIYVDGKLVCNYDNLSQLTNDISLTLIPRGGNGDLRSVVSYIRLGLDSAYHSNSSKITELTSFSEIIDLPNAIVNDIEHTPDGVLIGTKDISGVYSKIYNYNPSKKNYYFGVESIALSSFVVNNVNSSPNNESFAVSTNRGASIFKGDPLIGWDSSVEFRSLADLSANNWISFSSSGNAGISMSSDGLLISNDFKTVGRLSTLKRNNQLEYPALSFKAIFINNFYISVSDGYFQIKSNGDPDLIEYSIELLNYTVSELVSYVKDLPASVNGLSYIRDYFNIEILNGSGDEGASGLITMTSLESVALEYVVYINNAGESVDPYADAFQTSYTGGKSYIAHDSAGSIWYDSASSDRGYSIELNLKISPIEDSLRPIEGKAPDLFGMYVNDGSFEQEIQLYSDSIFISRLGRRLAIDLTDFTNLRFNGHNGQMQIWKKSSTDRDYSLLGDLSLTNISKMSRNAKKHVAVVRNDVHYLMWLEENGDFDVIKYSTSSDGISWDVVKTVPVYNISIRNIDLAVDSSGIMFIAYEAFGFDHSDIFILSKNEYGWSTQYNVTNDRGSSMQPRLFADESNSIHLIWSDSRSGIYEIMHSYLDGYSRAWMYAGASAQRVSSSNYGSHSPALTGRSGNIFAVWTENGTNGGSQVKISKYNIVEGKWAGQGGLSVDIVVSDAAQTRADSADVVVGKDGSIHIVYHDLLNEHFRIMHRSCSASLDFSQEPFPIVDLKEKTDSVRPKISLVDSSGDLIVSWNKVNQYSPVTSSIPEYDINDPYVPNIFVEENTSFSGSTGVFFARWSIRYRLWLSSGSKVSTADGGLGGFDVALKIDNVYPEFGVAMPKMLYPRALIGLLISDIELNGLRRVFAYELDTLLPYRYLTYDNKDPYSYGLYPISDYGPKKSLLIGDASTYVSGAMYIKSVKYSVSGKQIPFSYRKVGYLTHLMSSDPIVKTFVSDDGDAWLINKSGFYYYNFAVDDVANSWASELWLKNNLNYIIGSSNPYSIKDAFIDYFGNLYAVVIVGSNVKILVSSDHTRWFELKIKDFDLDISKNIKIAFNGRSNMVVSQIGKTAFIKNYIQVFRDKIINSSASITGENAANLLTVELTAYALSAAPAILGILDINHLSLDEVDNIFISTNLGLYFGQISNITLLTRQDGMPSDIIKSVYPIDPYTRLCTYENTIAYMNGSIFDEVPLVASYPISSVNGIVARDQVARRFEAGKLINSLTYGDYILTSGKNGLIVRFDGDPVLGRRLPVSAFFGAELLDVISAGDARNVQIKEMKFNLPDEIRNDPKINSYLVEVYLNGNPITRGYEFSAKEQVLYFLSSLLSDDVVTFNLRSDFRIDNDFAQNGAEKIAFGVEDRNIKMISYNSNQSYAVIFGAKDYIAVKDPKISLPYDEVVLDRKPPQGKVKFISQTGPDSIILGIDQILNNERPLPYDEASGIASMIISNYNNFTSDGAVPVEPVPFRSIVAHDLITALSNNTIIKETELDNFSKLFKFTMPNSVEKTYVITSSPIKIYERSTAGIVSDIPVITLEEGNTDYEIGFVQKFGTSLIIGTRSISGLNAGKLYKSSDLESFEIIAVLPGSGATSGFISSFDQSLYIGIDGSMSNDPSGSIIKYDGSSVTTYKTRLDKSVTSISGLERFLYAGTYSSGYIYRIDLASNVVEIVHADASGEVMSIAVLGVGIFAGVAENGTIIRAKNNDAGFIQSFRTTPSDVQLLKTLTLSNGSVVLFAAVGNKLYSFRNTWTLEGNALLSIKDFIVDENGTIIYCSAKQIKSVQSNTASVRKVFVKLIDNAGNETDIRSAPDATPVDGYNDNLTLTLTSSELKTTYLQSKLLEVDSEGRISYSINGDAPFYAGERILKETGVYYSDIFNGTTGHVSWNSFAWQGSAPLGTSIKMYIRVSDSRAVIDSAPFNLEIDQTQNDIDISFLSGQYLQIKVVLSSTTDISPYVSRIVITNNAGSASHFFTNTFPLPSNVRRGIITTEKQVPVGADILIGVTGDDSTDFSQYQIVPENRIFTLDSSVQGSKLRVGFRFITPQSVSTSASGQDVGTVEGMGSILSNSVAFDFSNDTGASRLVDFKVEFFEGANLFVKKASFDSMSSSELFRVNGNPYPSGGGISVPSGFEYRMHFIPFGAELSCDITYYVKVSLIEGGMISQYGGILPFRKVCGVNFINNIVFNYVNSQDSLQDLHFEISFYEDEQRKRLFKTTSSQIRFPGYNFLADFFPYPNNGLFLEPGQSSAISLNFNSAALLDFDQTKTYYVTVSYFDVNSPNASKSVESMNFTFKANSIDSTIECGAIAGVPVLNGFSLMFELEDGRLIKFNYLS